MAGFAAAVRRFRNRALARVDLFGRILTTSVLGELVRLSPVGDSRYWRRPAPAGYVGGHFRANWQVGLDSRPTGTVEGVDPGGEATVAAGAAVLAGYRLGRRVSIVNNVDYARRLEYGWSSQAPRGVVRVTRARLGELVLRAADAARRGA